MDEYEAAPDPAQYPAWLVRIANNTDLERISDDEYCKLGVWLKAHYPKDVVSVYQPEYRWVKHLQAVREYNRNLRTTLLHPAPSTPFSEPPIHTIADLVHELVIGYAMIVASSMLSGGPPQLQNVAKQLSKLIRLHWPAGAEQFPSIANYNGNLHSLGLAELRACEAAALAEARKVTTGGEITDTPGGKDYRQRTGDDSPAKQLATLQKVTPQLDKGNGQWVSNKLAADLDGVKARTLADYRQDGIRNTTGTLGKDRDGRIWRRPGTPTSHPWYLKSSLKSQQANHLQQ